MSNNTVFISCEHVTKKYKSICAVNDVSLDIFNSETLGLAGESGCGKTTLAQILLKLIPHDSGIILWNGKDLKSINHKDIKSLRKDAQIIYQDSYASLNPKMKIRDILAEPLIVHNFGDKCFINKRISEVLDDVNLSVNCLDAYPHQLSGGQRQRVSIARAIILKPKFIICDEIVSSLDVSVQNQILNLLKKLKKEYGLTCLFISHNMSVLRYMSDRIAVMKNGKIVEIGNSDELYNDPQNEYTKVLVNAVLNTRV